MNDKSEENVTDKELAEKIVVQASSEVAEKILSTPQCWDILHTLHQSAATVINVETSIFIQALMHCDVFKPFSDDPEDFEKLLKQICKFNHTYNSVLIDTFKLHSGKSGQPSAEEIVQVLEISERYTTVIDQFNNQLKPVMDTFRPILQQVVMAAEQAGMWPINSDAGDKNVH